MKTQTLQIATGSRRYTDLTDRISEFLQRAQDGLCSVFVPHATAGLAIFELGAGSDDDLSAVLDELLPRDDRWIHRHGSRGHGADHVLPAFLAPSITVPVIAGRLALGTWQSIVLVDPNPDNRSRSVILSLIPG